MAGFLFTGSASGDFKDPVLGQGLGRVISMKEVIFMNQTHSDRVVKVDASTHERVDADAIVTTTKGLALAVLAADCLPILLLGDGAVAAVHAGRLGVESELITHTVDLMNKYCSKNIRAVIGPSICADCYEVSPHMYEEFLVRRPEAATTAAKHSLDLKAAASALLQAKGVEVSDIAICTREDSSYFSYRRDATSKRHVGAVWL